MRKTLTFMLHDTGTWEALIIGNPTRNLLEKSIGGTILDQWIKPKDVALEDFIEEARVRYLG